MLNASSEFKQKLANGAKLWCSVTITLKDGTELNFSKGDFLDGGFEIQRSVSGTSALEIGYLGSAELDLKLINYDGSLNNYDFDGARVSNVGISMYLDDSSVETVYQGTFYVDTQDFNNGLVTLTCYDALAFLTDTYNSGNSLTANDILYYICKKYGIENTLTLHNDVLTIDSNYSYTDREILSYLLQSEGINAYMNADNKLVAADFTTYIGVIDTPVMSVNNIGLSQVKITGISVTDKDNKNTYVAGTTDYLISISGNPLIDTYAATELQYIYGKWNGIELYPLEVTTLQNPLIMPGDRVGVKIKDTLYTTCFTNVTYSIGSYTELRIGLSSVKKASTSNSNTTTALNAKIDSMSEVLKAYADSKTDATGEMSKELTNLVAESLGFYQITETQEDGSVIIYLSTKPTLTTGTTVWRMAGNVFTVTNNYQGDSTVWQAGFDAQGNAVYNLLSVNGLNANWINAGAIDASVIDVKNLSADKITTGSLVSANYVSGSAGCKVNLDTGVIEANNLTIVSGKSMSDVVDSVDNLQSSVDSLNKRVDGEVEVYYSEVVPTFDNYPANEWFVEYYPPTDNDSAEDYQFPGEYTWAFTDEAYRKHLGSVVYVKGSTSTYRFQVAEDGTFEWHEVENSETAVLNNRVSVLELTAEGLTNTVSGQTLEIGNLQTEVENKLDTDTYDTDQTTILARLTKDESSIQQNTDSITSRVTKTVYESDMKTLNNTVDGQGQSLTNLSNNLAQNYSTTAQMTSAISQKADEITSSVSETYESKSDLANNYYTKTQTDSAISVKADSILQTVSGTYETKSDMSNYSTTTQMDTAINSAVSSSESSVRLYVKGEVSTLYENISDVRDIADDADEKVAELDLVVYKDTDTGKLMSAINANADSLNLTGNQTISMKSGNFTLESDNTKIDSTGKITCNSLVSNNATITGGTIKIVGTSGVDTILVGDDLLNRTRIRPDFFFSGSNGTYIKLDTNTRTAEGAYIQMMSNGVNTFKMDSDDITLSANGNIYLNADDVAINGSTVLTGDAIQKLYAGTDYAYMGVATSSGVDYGITWWQSDARLKKNIEDAEVSGLDFVDNIKHRQFEWNTETRTGKVDLGYIAQEIQELDSGCVKEIPQTNNQYYDELLQIDETRIIPYLSKAIQELHAIVKSQDARIKELEEKLNGTEQD